MRVTLEKNKCCGYAYTMTLSERNHVFKAGIILSFVCLLQCVLVSIKAIPVYALMETEIGRRPGGIFQGLIGNFSDPRLLAVHFCISAMVLYSFLSIIFIHYFFEKTQSPEILFVAFFASSFSIEALRLVLPIGWV